MKSFRPVFLLFFAISAVLLSACSGGGSGSSSGTGTVSLALTDAKPLLPDGVTSFDVTIDEVLVHKSGGKWESLQLVETPYTIDLLQFTDGNTTEFVPPTPLEIGKYTQLRLVVSSAIIGFSDGTTSDATIPSDNLKTDKNFEFDVAGYAVDITVDFDLSQSLVAQGPDGSPPYQLKPVLHVVETSAAATVTGTINNTSFTDEGSQEAIVTVYAYHAIEQTWTEYTTVVVPKFETVEQTTEFRIYWLVPNEGYLIEIDFNPSNDTADYQEEIDPDDPNIGPGQTYVLNDAFAI